MKILLLVTIFSVIAYDSYAADLSNVEQNIVPIIDGYSFDNSSLTHHPEVSEEVLTNRAGMIFYETVTYPEFWTVNIIRGRRQIPCKIYCTNETWPKLEAEQNMPMGVLRYLRDNICAENKTQE